MKKQTQAERLQALMRPADWKARLAAARGAWVLETELPLGPVQLAMTADELRADLHERAKVQCFALLGDEWVLERVLVDGTMVLRGYH